MKKMTNKKLIINLPEMAKCLYQRYDTITNLTVLTRIYLAAGIDGRQNIEDKNTICITVPKSSEICFEDSDGEIKELAGVDLAKQYKIASFSLIGRTEEEVTNLKVMYKETDEHITYESFVKTLLLNADVEKFIDESIAMSLKKYRSLNYSDDKIREVVTGASTLFMYGISVVPIFFDTENRDITKTPDRIAYLVPQRSKFKYKGSEILGTDALEFINDQFIPPLYRDCKDFIVFAIPGFEADGELYKLMMDHTDKVVKIVKDIMC